MVVNCHFGYFPAETNTICVNVEQLRSAEKMPVRLILWPYCLSCVVGVGFRVQREHTEKFKNKQRYVGVTFNPSQTSYRSKTKNWLNDKKYSDVLKLYSVRESVNVMCVNESNHPTFLVHCFVIMSLGTNKASKSFSLLPMTSLYYVRRNFKQEKATTRNWIDWEDSGAGEGGSGERGTVAQVYYKACTNALLWRLWEWWWLNFRIRYNTTLLSPLGNLSAAIWARQNIKRYIHRINYTWDNRKKTSFYVFVCVISA